MASSLRIGLIGDRNEAVRAHTAIPSALAMCGASFELEWLPTSGLETDEDLRRFDGLWCVPGSPYASMQGALWAILQARRLRIPFLGTCGGFQHALIEFARNELGVSLADHAESNPQCEVPLIHRLSCSLVGVRARIVFAAGSVFAEAYGTTSSFEDFHCNYGVNTTYAPSFAESALRFSAFDEAGAPRGLEVLEHPFFVATLFQPELSVFEGKRHPLLQAFVRHCAA